MKARKLTSGSWNVRIMICGKSYSFTDPDKHRCIRRASEFAEMCHEDIDNPRLLIVWKSTSPIEPMRCPLPPFEATIALSAPYGHGLNKSETSGLWH